MVVGIPADALHLGGFAIPESTLIEKLVFISLIVCCTVVESLADTIRMVDIVVARQQLGQLGHLILVGLLRAYNVEVVVKDNLRHRAFTLGPRIAVSSIGL